MCGKTAKFDDELNLNYREIKEETHTLFDKKLEMIKASNTISNEQKLLH
ncbi:MAG: hypothetical protein R3Y64_10755 [Peptostreptococcaceae bacterium]